MNILNAVIAGLAATVVFTMVLMMAPKMGMPKMDIVSLLGSMLGKPNQLRPCFEFTDDLTETLRTFTPSCTMR